MLKGMKERSGLPCWRPCWWCGILRSLSAWLLDEFMHVCWSIISVRKDCLPKLTSAITITSPEKVLRASHREYFKKKKSFPPEISGLQAMESCTKQQQSKQISQYLNFVTSSPKVSLIPQMTQLCRYSYYIRKMATNSTIQRMHWRPPRSGDKTPGRGNLIGERNLFWLTDPLSGGYHCCNKTP